MSRPNIFLQDHQVQALCQTFSKSQADLSLIDQIIQKEWAFHDQVQGLHGRASCQDCPLDFYRNRLAQYLVYTSDICLGILDDLNQLEAKNMNPQTGKYARMMALTDPDLYQDFKDQFQYLSPVKAQALKDLGNLLQKGLVQVKKDLPQTSTKTRPQETQGKAISSVDYYLAEVSFYSLKTIWLIKDCIFSVKPAIFIERIYHNTLRVKNILS